MVFGNNTTSDISKLSKIPQAAKRQVVFGNFEILRAGIIAKYYIQVMLLFVYNRSREIFGNAWDTLISFYGWKNKHRCLCSQQSFHVNGRKWLTGFCETSTNHSRQKTWNSSMKVIYKSRSLQWWSETSIWYNKATIRLWSRHMMKANNC